MKNEPKFYALLFALISIFCITGCKSDNSSTKDVVIDQIVIRMEVEPESINPMMASSSIAREVYQYMFANLADYDYETLELKPELLKDVPEAIEIEERADGSTVKYEMEIKDDAVWTDGSAITGYDVDFSFKLAAHPGINTPTWNPVLNFLNAIDVDPDNPKKFTLYSGNVTFLSKEYLLSAEVYPRHIFDSEGILSTFTISDLKNMEGQSEIKMDSSFVELAKEFSSMNFDLSIEGAGPYYLENHETGQFIVLRKKNNYWGEAYPDIDGLESNPDRIIFQIVKDPTTATTLLKDGELDIMDLSKGPYTTFNDLKKDSIQNSKFDFFTPQIPRYLYFLVNNDDNRLSEKAVRIALDHLTDKERIIKQLEGGYAQKVNSIIQPSKYYYNKNLGFRSFDIEKANDILENSGWIDSNGDGTRDKVLNGRREELSLRFHLTGSDKSTAIVNILKDACRKAGIEIVPVIKPYSATALENFIPGDYELSVTRVSQHPVKDDPYTYWHSSSVGEGGRNYNKFSNNEADRLMELIRSAKDDAVQIQAFMDLQLLMFDESPVIFLYSDQLRIVANKSKKPVVSGKNPGYFVNAVEEL